MCAPILCPFPRIHISVWYMSKELKQSIRSASSLFWGHLSPQPDHNCLMSQSALSEVYPRASPHSWQTPKVKNCSRIHIQGHEAHPSPLLTKYSRAAWLSGLKRMVSVSEERTFRLRWPFLITPPPKSGTNQPWPWVSRKYKICKYSNIQMGYGGGAISVITVNSSPL